MVCLICNWWGGRHEEGEKEKKTKKRNKKIPGEQGT